MQPTPVSAATSAPFDLRMQPADAVQHQGWRRACRDALAALRQREPVALLGLPGTGKTFLLQSLGQILRSEGLRVHSLAAAQTPGPGLGPHADVLLVDEADRLSDEALEAIRDWNGNFIVAGLPGMAERLARRACLVETVTLAPLSPEDVARFVAARLSATGHRRDLLEPDAVLALARHSAGLLRLVIVLAGSAMFLADHEGAERVGKRHVDEAAAMRQIGSGDEPTQPDPAPPTRQPQPSRPVPMVARRDPEPAFRPGRRAGRAALGLGGLVLLVVLGWVLWGSPPPRPPVPQQAAGSLPSPPVVPESVQVPVSVPVSVPVPAPDQLPVPRLPALAAPPATTVPTPPSSARAAPVLAFQGPILNRTINQKGHLSLEIRRLGPTNVMARFHASAGLIGSGDLAGTMAADGRITLSGRLMMGRNPFDTTLTATIAGDRLDGTATFIRPETGSMSQSSFDLTR